jgi:hypothetical protein
LASLGDINGDGTPDLTVGAHGDAEGGFEKAGRAYVMSGASGEVLQALSSPNAEQKGYFGSVESLRDIDGDGTLDLALGALGESVRGSKAAGRVYIITTSPRKPVGATR